MKIHTQVVYVIVFFENSIPLRFPEIWSCIVQAPSGAPRGPHTQKEAFLVSLYPVCNYLELGASFEKELLSSQVLRCFDNTSFFLFYNFSARAYF